MFAFIDDHRQSYPIVLLCKALGISASDYYAWRRRPLSRRAEGDCVLQRRIAAIHAASRGIYGSPKIHAQLQQEGLACSRKRVIRLMRQAHVCAKRQRCFKRTTRRNPAHTPAPNRLEQHFAAAQPDQVWLADITYICTAEGWLYLAAVMDLFTRAIVGWSMADHLQATLVEQALLMALGRRRPTGNVLHHSDQGSQYTSDLIQSLLAAHHIQVSMSGVGNCYDNAPMESFFGRLKTECVTAPFATRAEARLVIFEHIEVWYNRQRLHSALGFLSPATFEQRHYETFPVR